MSDNTQTSPTLLLRLRHSPGDESAWALFIRRYGPSIHRWCRKWGVQESDAADITQTVLLRLIERLKTFDYDPKASFRAWLKTVTYHAWIRFIEQLSKKEKSGLLLEVLDRIETRDDLVSQIDEEYQRERLELAMAAVAARVESRTWQAFQLTAIENRPGADVAATLQMKVASVYVARSKVQRMIRELIQTEEV